MADPFQDVDSGGPEFIKKVGDALEIRAAEPILQQIVESYLVQVAYPDDGLHVEVGAGSGAIARRIAIHAANGTVIATDPSPGLIGYAKAQSGNPENLHFEVSDGCALSQSAGSVDTVFMHTVLSHVPDPAALLVEAHRVLKSGGTLVVCDADFEKVSIGNAFADPLNACAEYFSEHFVTDKFLVSKLRSLLVSNRFALKEFRVMTRVITEGLGGLTYVAMGGQMMVDRGLIGQPFLDALIAEYHRRIDDGSFYGFVPMAIAIGTAQSPQN